MSIEDNASLLYLITSNPIVFFSDESLITSGTTSGNPSHCKGAFVSPTANCTVGREERIQFAVVAINHGALSSDEIRSDEMR